MADDNDNARPLFTPEEIARLRETARAQAAARTDLPAKTADEVHAELHGFASSVQEGFDLVSKTIVDQDKVLAGAARLALASLGLSVVAVVLSLRRRR